MEDKKSVLGFRFRLMSQADADAISRWNYPDQYAFYNWETSSTSRIARYRATTANPPMLGEGDPAWIVLEAKRLEL